MAIVAVYPEVPYQGTWQFVEHNHHVTLYQYRSHKNTGVRYNYNPAAGGWLVDCDNARRPTRPKETDEIKRLVYALVTVVGLPTGAPYHPPLTHETRLTLPQPNRYDFLFRVLRHDEEWRGGLIAKAPDAAYRPNYHSSGTHPTQSISFMSVALAGSFATLRESVIAYIGGAIQYTGERQAAYTVVVVQASAVLMPVVAVQDVVTNRRTRRLAAKWHEKTVDVFVPAGAIRYSVVAADPSEMRARLEEAWFACYR